MPFDIDRKKPGFSEEAGLLKLRQPAIDPALPYLVKLTFRLAEGLERLPAEQRQQHLRFFRSQQLRDGGFCGRGGASDLYYTAFALRGLAVLGNDDQEVALRAAAYLRDQLQRSVGVIDLISLVFAARLLEASLGESPLAEADARWPHSVADTLEQLRRADGGYAKSAEGHASSTYQTFLITLIYELLELPQPATDRARDFLLSQQRDDGGFVEISAMRRSGTNPTAAAVGALRVLDAPPVKEANQAAVKFLLANVTDEGGLRANTQIPVADLLSTFTGLQTLADLDAIDQVDREAARQYVDSLQQPAGGFLAAVWDEAVDVEYSFYGIGALGLLLVGD